MPGHGGELFAFDFFMGGIPFTGIRMSFINFDGDGKTFCRNIATSNNSTVYKEALFLPSSRMLCVRHALAQGIVDRKTTHFLLAERDSRIADKIERQCDELDLHNVTILEGDLATINLGTAVDDQVDYAFFDFCGVCSAKTLDWLLETSRHWLSPTARLAFTLCNKFRGHEYRWLTTALRHYQGSGGLPRHQADRLLASENNWVYMVPPTHKKSSVAPLHDRVRLQHVMLAQSLPYQWDVQHSILYRDTSYYMAFYHGQLTGQENPDYQDNLNGLLADWFAKGQPRYEIQEPEFAGV